MREHLALHLHRRLHHLLGHVGGQAVSAGMCRVRRRAEGVEHLRERLVPHDAPQGGQGVGRVELALTCWAIAEPRACVAISPGMWVSAGGNCSRMTSRPTR